MKQTTNNGTFTQKALSECARWYNAEYANIYGCLRAMLALNDKAPKDVKNALKVLGLTDRKKVDIVADLVRNNQPIVAIDTNGNVVPFERVTKRVAETKETIKIERPIEKWNFRKVLNAIRVIQGTKEQINISATNN